MCFSNVDLQAVFRFEVVLTLVTLENFLHSIISGSQGDKVTKWSFRMYDTNIPIHYSKLKHHICVTFAVIIGRPTIYVFQFLECLKITLKSQFRQFEFNTLNP